MDEFDTLLEPAAPVCVRSSAPKCELRHAVRVIFYFLNNPPKQTRCLALMGADSESKF